MRHIFRLIGLSLLVLLALAACGSESPPANDVSAPPVDAESVIDQPPRFINSFASW